MSHELDNTHGVYYFADARTDAWHRLGQQVGHAMTAEEALSAAHLAGWNVHKRPLHITGDPILADDGVTAPTPIPVTDAFATVRTNPITGTLDVLGVVGNKYKPVQNEASCTILNTLTDESGAVYETAGALRGGRETFVTLKLRETMTFEDRDGSADRTDWYLAALNSHDGNSKFRLLLTPVRIVCANTQSAAIAGARHSFGSRTPATPLSESLRRATHFACRGTTSRPSRPKRPPSMPPTWRSTRCAGSPTVVRRRRRRSCSHPQGPRRAGRPDRQTVDLQPDRGTDPGSHPLGGLQRRQRMGRPRRPGPRRQR
jgi:Domain of unknown function (DUF932)